MPWKQVGKAEPLCTAECLKAESHQQEGETIVPQVVPARALSD